MIGDWLADGCLPNDWQIDHWLTEWLMD